MNKYKITYYYNHEYDINGKMLRHETILYDSDSKCAKKKFFTKYPNCAIENILIKDESDNFIGLCTERGRILENFRVIIDDYICEDE